MSRTIVITGCSGGFGSDSGVVHELNRLVEQLCDQLWADKGLADVATLRPSG